MTEGCSRLTVTQVGGFAGNIALPPLVDACRQLSAAAQFTAAEPMIGADLAGYRVEMVGAGDETRSFSLPGSGATTNLTGQTDVPQLLAPLLALSGGSS
jgi:hypothetical protein